MSTNTGKKVIDNTALSQIIENNSQGLFIVDKNQTIQYLNKAAANLFQHNQDDLIGKKFQQSIQTGQSSKIKIKHKDGKYGVGEMHVLDTTWNNSPAYQIAIEDITQRLLYDQLRNDFISNVSHEIRTPLTVMRESVAQVHDGVMGEINTEQQRFLSICLRNADLLKKIVDDLLDISKIEAGQIEFHKVRVNVADLIKSTIEDFIPIAKKNGLELKISLPKNQVSIYVDQDRIIQVFNNLIYNAIKFTEKGWIGVSVQAVDDRVKCSVQDTGIGIAQEDVPKVFNKFEQFGQSTIAAEKGTGLGLSISQEIIRRHKGKIVVESIIKKGTSFIVDLPRYNAQTVLQDQIFNRIKSAQKPFILYTIQLHNLDQIQEMMSQQFVYNSTRKIEQQFEEIGKKMEPIFIEGNNTIFYAEDMPKNQEHLTRQIVGIVKKAFFSLETDYELDFSWGTAIYPNDGETPERLMEASQKKMKNETVERLTKSIVVVDDLPEMTDEMQALLDVFGYRNITLFNESKKGYAWIMENNPDLIILDMMMPEMSGYEMIGRLKEDHKTKEIPILIASGFELETKEFNDYTQEKAILTISKPAKPELLRKMVYYLIR